MNASYTFEPSVRLRDIDRNGHVNHPVYAEYLGETRAAYYRDVIGADMSTLDTVVVHISIDFVEPVEYADSIRVDTAVTEIGTSSLTMEYDVRRADGTTVATATTVQVRYGGSGDESRPIPDAWRRAIRDREGWTDYCEP
ncbi:acyl-CoA thioesterase [Natronorubrum sp. FCH18a]|uniref:acyl-CoA thioesterase n=1 Tax=Natronorubrum sp. FCH18a TaxID=3447018 RepID=UPI003F512DCE